MGVQVEKTSRSAGLPVTRISPTKVGAPVFSARRRAGFRVTHRRMAALANKMVGSDVYNSVAVVAGAAGFQTATERLA